MRLLISALALAVCLGAQTSNYPASIDNDASLYVAGDNVQTTLASAMAPGDSVAIIKSCAPVTSCGFAVAMIATVCDATATVASGVTKCTLWEHMKVTGVSGNQLTVQRGQLGTAAGSHSAGKLISILIDAGHQAALKNAIIAVETALGQNLSNIPKSPVVSSTQYAFGPITAGAGVSVSGGNLVIGANVLTFSVVPLGVNGTDTNHWIEVTGGTGITEDCLITGGSGTAGQTNGQIIATCGANHSGAWTVKADGGGIREACQANAPARIAVPPGSYDVYQTITPPSGCLIDGQVPPSQNGPTAAVNLNLQKQGIALFNLANFGTGIVNAAVNFGTPPVYTVGGSAATAGAIGITSAVNAQVQNVILHGFYNDLIASGGTMLWANVIANNSVQDCIVVGAVGAGWVYNVLAQACGRHGFNLQPSIGAPQYATIGAFNTGGWGIYASSGGFGNGPAFQMDDVDAENNYSGNILLDSINSNSASMQNVIAQGGGSSIAYGSNTTAPCVRLASTSANNFMTISNLNIAGCEGNGLEVDGNFSTLIGGNVTLAGVGGAPGHLYAIESSGTTNGISGFMTFGNGSYFNGAVSTIRSNRFAGGGVVTIGSSFTGQFADNYLAAGSMVLTAGCSWGHSSNFIAGGAAAVTGTCTDDQSSIRTTISSGTTTAVAGAAALNTQSGTVTSESLTTAAGAVYTLTLTDALVTPSSVIIAQVYNGTNTGGAITGHVRVTPGSGVATLIAYNDGASAFNGTIKIQFYIANTNY